MILWIVVFVVIIFICCASKQETFETSSGRCPPDGPSKNAMGPCFYTEFVCKNGESICYPCRSKTIFKICKPAKKRIGEAACQALFGVGLKKRHSECNVECNGWDLRGCVVT